MASDETTRRLRKAEYLKQYLANTGREYATGKNIKCPNAAAHKNGDANPSAKIYENPDGALIKCYGCGGKWDIFSLWQIDNGGTFAEAKSALCDLFNISKEPGNIAIGCNSHTSNVNATHGIEAERHDFTTDHAATATPDRKTAEYINKCAVEFQVGANGDEGRTYLTGRGISFDTARSFKVGYDHEHHTIIIPQGAGYMARSTMPDVSQKDKCRYYPKGAPRVLFNGGILERAANDGTPIFIVEGEIDALSIAEVGGVAVSTGGASGTGKIIQAARRIGRGVYVPCLDRDNTGVEAQAKLTAKLREIGGAVYVYADAPQILLPDATDGTHPKDANEALLIDAAAFRSRVAEVIRAAKELAATEEEKHRPYLTLADVPEPPNETTNPRALFKRGYLRKGGGIIAASVAGAGKSTFSLQCALHWVMGFSCFGIDPVRPLKIAVIQAEDDIEELAMFRANMKQGLTAEGFAPEEIDEAMKRLHIRTDFLGKTGADFANALGIMQSRFHYDLVIVNPLNSYFDGDISLNKDASEFFRKMIDPVIKNSETECGILFVHHMAKPAKGKEAATFAKGAYAQYALQGGAELNNWARAVLIMIPFDGAPDFWTLTAAKRHKPLAWTDENGEKTKDKVIAYSENYIYWREPTAEEIRAAQEGRRTIKETEEERRNREKAELTAAQKEIVDFLQNLKTGISKSNLYKWCDTNPSAVFKGFHSHTAKNPKTGENYPKRPCFLAYELIVAGPLSYGVGYSTGKYKNGKTYELYGGIAPVTGSAPTEALQSGNENEEADDTTLSGVPL